MKPLLLLDVDGVLCPFGGDDETHLEPIIGHEYAHIDPQHTAWLDELRKLYDFVWATFWEEDANSVIATAHELDPMPFIEFSKYYENAAPDKLLIITDQTPKLQAVKDYVEDKPLAWAEDDLFEDAHKWAYERNKTIPTRLIHTDPRVGLDEAAMHDLRLFGYTFQNS